jgi:hypothetical protein
MLKGVVGMCFRYKRMKSFTGMQLLLSVLLVLQIALVPLAYSNTTSSAERSAGDPISRYQKVYIINDIAVNEILNFVNINRIMNKYSGDVQRMIGRLHDVWIAPVVMLGILLAYTATYCKVFRQQMSVLSTSLGGHAPPAEHISHI